MPQTPTPARVADQALTPKQLAVVLSYIEPVFSGPGGAYPLASVWVPFVRRGAAMAQLATWAQSHAAALASQEIQRGVLSVGSIDESLTGGVYTARGVLVQALGATADRRDFASAQRVARKLAGVAVADTATHTPVAIMAAGVLALDAALLQIPVGGIQKEWQGGAGQLFYLNPPAGTALGRRIAPDAVQAAVTALYAAAAGFGGGPNAIVVVPAEDFEATLRVLRRMPSGPRQVAYTGLPGEENGVGARVIIVTLDPGHTHAPPPGWATQALGRGACFTPLPAGWPDAAHTLPAKPAPPGSAVTGYRFGNRFSAVSTIGLGGWSAFSRAWSTPRPLPALRAQYPSAWTPTGSPDAVVYPGLPRPGAVRQSPFVTGTHARPAHLTSALSAGLFNGAELTTTVTDSAGLVLPRLLLKGSTTRELLVTRRGSGTLTTVNPGGHGAPVQTRLQTFAGVETARMNLTVLDLANGNVHTVAMNLDPAQNVDTGTFKIDQIRVKDILVHYQGALLDQLTRRMIPIEDLHAKSPGRVQLTDYLLPPLKRPLFPAQANIVRALVKRQQFFIEHPEPGADRRSATGQRVGRRPPGALVIGEVGSGKTATALGFAATMGAKQVLVVCPDHLASTWGEEAMTVLGAGAAKVTYLRPGGVLDTDEEYGHGGLLLATHGTSDAEAAQAGRPAPAARQDLTRRRLADWLQNAKTDARMQIGVVTIKGLSRAPVYTAIRGACPRCGKPHPRYPLIDNITGVGSETAVQRFKHGDGCRGLYLQPGNAAAQALARYGRRLAIWGLEGSHADFHLPSPGGVDAQQWSKTRVDLLDVLSQPGAARAHRKGLAPLVVAPATPKLSPADEKRRAAAVEAAHWAGRLRSRIRGTLPLQATATRLWLAAAAAALEIGVYAPEKARKEAWAALRAQSRSGVASPLGSDAVWQFLARHWSAPDPRTVAYPADAKTVLAVLQSESLAVSAPVKAELMRVLEEQGLLSKGARKMAAAAAARRASPSLHPGQAANPADPAPQALCDVGVLLHQLALQVAARVAQWRGIRCNAPVARLARTAQSTDRFGVTTAPDYRYLLWDGAKHLALTQALRSPHRTKDDEAALRTLKDARAAKPELLRYIASRWPVLCPGQRLLGPDDQGYPKRSLPPAAVRAGVWVLFAPVRGGAARPALLDAIMRSGRQLDLTIFDESHSYGNLGTAQTQAMLRLSTLPAFTLLLTGTVSGGTAEQLFPQLWAVSSAMRVRYPSPAAGLTRFLADYGYGTWSETAKAAAAGGALDADGEPLAHPRPDVFTGRVAAGGRLRGISKQRGSAPGVDPYVIYTYLLPASVGLTKLDHATVGAGVPPLTESLTVLAAGQFLVQQYDSLRAQLSGTAAQVSASAHAGMALLAAHSLARDYLDAGFAGRQRDPKKIEAGSYTPPELQITPEQREVFTLAWEQSRYALRWPQGSAYERIPAAVVPLWEPGYVSPKEERLIELVRAETRPESGPRRPVMVCYNLSVLEDRLVALLRNTPDQFVVVQLSPGGRASDRAAEVSRMLAKAAAAGKPVDVLVVQPTKVQTGLNNLTYFATLIWMENPAMNATTYRQMVGRIDRIGQTQPTKSIRLVYAEQYTLESAFTAKLRESRNMDALDLDTGLRLAGVGVTPADAALASGSTADVGKALYAGLTLQAERAKFTDADVLNAQVRAMRGETLTDFEAQALAYAGMGEGGAQSFEVEDDPSDMIKAAVRTFTHDPKWPLLDPATAATLFRFRVTRYRGPSMQTLLSRSGRPTRERPAISEPAFAALQQLRAGFAGTALVQAVPPPARQWVAPAPPPAPPAPALTPPPAVQTAVDSLPWALGHAQTRIAPPVAPQGYRPLDARGAGGKQALQVLVACIRLASVSDPVAVGFPFTAPFGLVRDQMAIPAYLRALARLSAAATGQTGLIRLVAVPGATGGRDRYILLSPTVVAFTAAYRARTPIAADGLKAQRGGFPAVVRARFGPDATPAPGLSAEPAQVATTLAAVLEPAVVAPPIPVGPLRLTGVAQQLVAVADPTSVAGIGADVARGVADRVDRAQGLRIPLAARAYPEQRAKPLPNGQGDYRARLMAGPTKQADGTWHSWWITDAWFWLLVPTKRKPAVKPGASAMSLAGLYARRSARPIDVGADAPNVVLIATPPPSAPATT